MTPTSTPHPSGESRAIQPSSHGPMRAAPAPASQLDHYVVTDPRGVVAGGTHYPTGTLLSAIPGAAGMLRTWVHFSQVGISADLQRTGAPQSTAP